MSRTKVAIYSCHIPYNEENRLLNEEKIRDVQKEIGSDNVVGIFEDLCAATTPLEERPELQKLLEMCERGEIDEIAVPQAKRLAKSIELLLDIFNKFHNARVMIKCFEEGINNYRPYFCYNWDYVIKNMKRPEHIQNKNVKNVILYYGHEAYPAECEEHQRNIQEYKRLIEADESLNLVKTIIDREIEGKPIMEREGIKDLMRECTTHNVDMVYTAAAETLASATHDFIKICQELEKLEIGVKIMDSELIMRCDEKMNFTMTMM